MTVYHCRIAPTATIGVARIFFGGSALFLTQNLITFFSHHLLFHGHMRYKLPPLTFVSHLRGCTSPDSAPFLPHFNKKCLEKIFFRRPAGVHLHPLHPIATPMLATLETTWSYGRPLRPLMILHTQTQSTVLLTLAQRRTRSRPFVHWSLERIPRHSNYTLATTTQQLICDDRTFSRLKLSRNALWCYYIHSNNPQHLTDFYM